MNKPFKKKKRFLHVTVDLSAFELFFWLYNLLISPKMAQTPKYKELCNKKADIEDTIKELMLLLESVGCCSDTDTEVD